MNIYLISQDHVNGYDTFDSAVVIAASEEDARRIHPRTSFLRYHPDRISLTHKVGHIPWSDPDDDPRDLDQ